MLYEVITLHDVDSDILDPRDTYKNKEKWNEKATHLAELFIENFKDYTDNEEGRKLIKAGPQIEMVK